MSAKQAVADLALFGGFPLFQTPKPVSNLARPEFDRFIAYVRQACSAGILADGGPLVRMLEGRLAQYHQVDHCVAFNSGFWALAIVFRALALNGRSEIVMPSLTYRRLSDIAAWAGLKPRFCDIDPISMTNGAAQVAGCINDDTALIVGVHPINGLADIDGLTRLARDAGLPLVFDSVESSHECHAGRRIGGFGDAEVFSLGASKLINGFEGGYVTTRQADLAQALRRRLSGTAGNESCREPRFNARMNEIHAAMALASLEDLDRQVVRNRRRYHAYQNNLAKLSGLRLLEFDEAIHPGYKNIIVEVLPDWPLDRDDTVRILNAEMVLARAYYPQPLHRKPMRYPHVQCDLPITDALAKRFILLPCGELVSAGDIDIICALLAFISGNAPAIGAQLTSMEIPNDC